MLQVLARFTVVVCALFAAQAYALGLGDINVKSKLNERFSASIPVLGATAAQLDAFSVKLAATEDFNRAGIERSDYLSSLHFEVQETPGGARVLVSSEQIAREPFLNFIVEARSPDGKLLREYTVLLDPPTLASDSSAPAYTSSQAPSQAPASSYPPPPVQKVPGPAPAPGRLAPAEAAQLAAEMPGAAKNKHAKAPKAAPAPAEAAEAPPPAAVAAAAPEPAAASTGGGATYGPTAPQETFWSIGVKLRPSPQVTMDQVLLAIYRANPGAFEKGSFNGLLKGRVLQVPSQADMQSTPPAEAKSLVESWRHGAAPGGVKKNTESVAAAAAAPPKAEKPAKAPKIKQGKPLPPLEPAAPAPLPAPAPAAAAPPPAPVPPPAPKAAAPTPPAPKPAAPTPAPAPAPAAPAASPAPVAAPKPAPSTPPPAPAAATPPPAAPAASSAPASSAPAPAAAPTPPPAPVEAVKPKPLPPPPAPEPGFFDEYGSTIGFLVFALVVVGCGVMIFRRKKPALPDFGAKLPSAGGFSNPFAKKGAPAPAPAPAPKAPPPPAAPALAPKKGPPGPPPMPKPQALKLGDTTALPDELAQEVTQEFGRTQVSDAPLAGAHDTARLTPPPLPPKAAQAPQPPTPPKPGDTAVLTPPQRVLQESIPQATPPPLGGEGGDVDFDLTSQFEAQTLSINLDANDPLSEADFHLAYGLYDEAASLLKQALVKEPKRQDLRVKLAETYFAGGKPVEFQETAEALHGQVSPAEWQKIAIMGRQLSPDAALFKSDGNVATPDVDLTLGDSIGPAAAQVIGAAPHAGGVIDFDLDSELAKSMPATPAAKPAAPAAAPKAASGEFDLSHFDLSAEPGHAAGGENTIEFDLDELDLSKPTAGGGHITSGDEIGTKLDLARVYADMGDNDAARGLLNEVMGTGNATQKGEAEALLKRLSA